MISRQISTGNIDEAEVGCAMAGDRIVAHSMMSRSKVDGRYEQADLYRSAIYTNPHESYSLAAALHAQAIVKE